ncbi:MULTISPECIES: hypothetical protein [Cyanophyceae]|uniref:hypothetical protein n=1 Tax=Cyanophyceae TaxID=3028117 RepID=UPI001685EEFD|nr:MULTISPECIES: hypothetical protein [Cyanophyceae]MBD1919210.1 hypothetical protein [Phormidium sp. FACHB-77]MBD2033440.1 hypothetical protein [Phormidium sp. FACHB-322]MBD2054162.1 hypothetical protein [Leptolyngbya sp. FACHB-60]
MRSHSQPNSSVGQMAVNINRLVELVESRWLFGVAFVPHKPFVSYLGVAKSRNEPAALDFA